HGRQEAARDLLERVGDQHPARGHGLRAEATDDFDPGLGLQHAKRAAHLAVGATVHGQEGVALVEREIGAGAGHRVDGGDLLLAIAHQDPHASGLQSAPLGRRTIFTLVGLVSVGSSPVNSSKQARPSARSLTVTHSTAGGTRPSSRSDSARAKSPRVYPKQPLTAFSSRTRSLPSNAACGEWRPTNTAVPPRRK